MVYVYDKYNPTNIGYVKGLYKDYANNLYYCILFPRTDDRLYINVHNMHMDENGMMYFEGDDGDINKMFIKYCKQFAGCTGCKYANYDNCKELFIRDEGE